MTPRIQLDTAQISGGETLTLYQRGDEFIIALGGNQLMSTRVSASEIALAELSIEQLAGNDAPHILIGGYGMGFTLRAALAKLGPQAHVTVAELVPQIMDWARGPMAELTGGCLNDPRVTIHIGDVGEAIASANARYDVILLDVDNGPDGLSRRSNDGLYSDTGLAESRRALRPGGILAIWSAAPDAKFAKRFAHAAFATEEISLRAHSKGRGARHVIWLGRR